MAERRRLFLTGSNRAEFEHIFGPLTVDETDPRFVLVDEETAEKIAALPPGIPVVSSQHPRDIAEIRAAELDAWGVEGDGSENVGAGRGTVVAQESDVEAAVESGDADEPSGEGETNEDVAESGDLPDGEPVRPSARARSKKSK